jgi:hypothetical protein
MQRIQINRMPFYSGGGENVIGRISAYRLSHIVSFLKFYKPSLRYPNRLDRIKSGVLRALCDRYPNVWPGLQDIADKAKCSPAQARRALRELEFQDRLIVDVNSRLTWRRSSDGRLVLESDDAGKKGGWGKKAPVQYFVCDRKIYDIYHHQQEWDAYEKKNRKRQPTQGREQAQSGEANQRTEQPNHGSMNAHSGEHESPLPGDSNQTSPPSPLIAEPTKNLTDYKEPASLTTTTDMEKLVADTGVRSISNSKTPPTLSFTRKEAELTDGEIMGEFLKATSAYTYENIRTTEAHRKTAIQFHKKHGGDIAIAAWVCYVWDSEDAEDGSVCTWRLKEFIDSGEAELWAARVQPYVRFGIRSPVIIDILLWVGREQGSQELEKLFVVKPELVCEAMKVLRGFESRGLYGHTALREKSQAATKADYDPCLQGFFHYLTENPFRSDDDYPFREPSEEKAIAAPFNLLSMMGDWERVPADDDPTDIPQG